MKNYSTISNYLQMWYLQNKRDLPWRHTTDPYPIWLSEIILQQTRVAQGLPYFEAFLKAFPQLPFLANAPEDEVLKLWQGLGYYSRARNLHATAQYIHLECNNVFPANYKGLLQLKGVGKYTAAAIASFAYNEPVAVVDGNVYRVLARIFGSHEDISSTQGKLFFEKLAQQLLDKTAPAQHNQAIMEFGALQCVPQNPDCTSCILKAYCTAFTEQTIAILPVKTKKTVVKKRYFDYLIVQDKWGNVLLNQRTQKDIWQNLYEFYLIENKEMLTIEAVTNQIKEHFSEKNIQKIDCYNKEALVHKLSHQQLHLRFWNVCIEEELPQAVALEVLHEKAFPIVLANFIKEQFL